MHKLISKLILVLICLLSCGCVATYRPIHPASLNYTVHDMQDGIGFSYKHDVLREKGNRKYANKEVKKELKLIAIKLTNNTDSAINVSRDLVFLTGQQQIFPMEPLAIKNTIRQVAPGYLFYMLLSFVNVTYYDDYRYETYPIGIIVAPIVTLATIGLATSANKNLLEELEENNIVNKTLLPGETAYGIIGIPHIGYDPITIKRTPY